VELARLARLLALPLDARLRRFARCFGFVGLHVPRFERVLLIVPRLP
jgi:hypothetical protein